MHWTLTETKNCSLKNQRSTQWFLYAHISSVFACHFSIRTVSFFHKNWSEFLTMIIIHFSKEKYFKAIQKDFTGYIWERKNNDKRRMNEKEMSWFVHWCLLMMRDLMVCQGRHALLHSLSLMKSLLTHSLSHQKINWHLKSLATPLTITANPVLDGHLFIQTFLVSRSSELITCGSSPIPVFLIWTQWYYLLRCKRLLRDKVHLRSISKV